MGWFSNLLTKLFTTQAERALLAQAESDYQARLKGVRAQIEAMQISDAELKQIADKLVPGELTENTNWMHIQSVGKFISPQGDDPVQEVSVWQRGSNQGEATLMASLEVTNTVYAEWLIACSNSMWHTEHVTAYDRHGQAYFLGKMLGTEVTQEYI